jgi:hypothetical protein
MFSHHETNNIFAVGVGDVVECAGSLITGVILVSPISGATGGSGNLVCLTLRGWRHIQNLYGFSTPTTMGQSFIMTLYMLYLPRGLSDS